MATPVPVLARGFKFEIDLGSGYVEVKGLETLSFGSDSDEAAWTLKEDNGNKNGIIANRGKTITASGKYLIDPDDGTRDPGQAAVETAAGYIDYQSQVKTRLTLPPEAEGEVIEMLCTYELSDIGGDYNDAAAWGFTATRRGANL